MNLLKSTPVYQVDAFTTEMFKGNPAAVVLLSDHFPTEEIMQSIAAENNLSETAFVVPEKSNHNRIYHIRWFTPLIEVNLCGHATLAAAHVLFNELNICSEKIEFLSKSGPLIITQNGSDITMDFPADVPHQLDTPNETLLQILLSSGFHADSIREVLQATEDLIIVLEDEKTVASLTPNHQALATIDTRCVIITAPGNDTDFVARVFAPRAGIPEDPARDQLIPL